MEDTTVITSELVTRVVEVDCCEALIISSPEPTTVITTEPISSVISSFCGPSYLVEVPRLTLQFTAAHDLVRDRVVRLNELQRAEYVNNTDLTDFDKAIGVTLHDADEGSTVRILTRHY